MTKRDMMKSRIFLAEQELLADPTLSLSIGLAECEDWVDAITTSRFWRAQFPRTTSSPARLAVNRPAARVDLAIRHGRDCGSALPSINHARCNRLGILHALAHHISRYSIAESGSNEAPHGTTFAGNYIKLVARFLPEAEQPLRAAFRERRIKTYTWSKVARQQASQRRLVTDFRKAKDKTRQLLAQLEDEKAD